jgi:KDO2-lipid IV(A) lauroyltransferase
MKFLQWILGWIALAIVAFLFLLYRLVPANKAYDFGASLAKLIYPLFKKRRKVAVDNVLKVGITNDYKQADKIARTAWGHLAGHICEALKVPGVVNKDNWKDHLDFSDADPVTVKLLLEETDKPIILVSSHHGVWEAATNVLSFARPMIAIARTMNNPVAARWMSKYHFRGPVTVIDKKHGFRKDIMDQWKRENSALTILMDQHYAKGLPLMFLGRPAKTFSTAAKLAIREGKPIVVGSFVRIAPFKYRLVGGSPLMFSSNDDKEKVTQILNDRLGDAIRKYPEQYLWMHRRWR